MHELAPELPVVPLAILSPQSPRLVRADIDDLAAAVTADRDDRLRRLAIGAFLGRVHREHRGLRMRPRNGLPPGEPPEVLPRLAVLRLVGAELHEVDERRLRREGEFEGLVLPRASCRIEDHRQHVADRRLRELRRPEPRARDHDQAAAKLLDELPRHLAEPAREGGGRHVAEEEDVGREEVGSRCGRRCEEELVRGPHLRVGRAEERAEAPLSHERVAMEDLLHEPPLPGRLILDIFEPEKIVADERLAGRLVVGLDRFPLDPLDRCDHLMAADRRGRERKLDGHRAGRERYRPGAHHDRCGLRGGGGAAGRNVEQPHGDRDLGDRVVKPRLPQRHRHRRSLVLFHHRRRLHVDRHIRCESGSYPDAIKRHAEPPRRGRRRRARVLVEVAHEHDPLQARGRVPQRKILERPPDRRHLPGGREPPGEFLAVERVGGIVGRRLNRPHAVGRVDRKRPQPKLFTERVEHVVGLLLQPLGDEVGPRCLFAVGLVLDRHALAAVEEEPKERPRRAAYGELQHRIGKQEHEHGPRRRPQDGQERPRAAVHRWLPAEVEPGTRGGSGGDEHRD